MKTLTQSLLYLLIASAQALATQTAPVEPQGIHAPQTHVDMGSVFKGEQTSHAFVIENRGTTELRITQVKLHCHCTSVALELGNPRSKVELDTHGQPPEGTQLLLPAGQSLDVVVTVNTTGMPPRKFTKSVDVFSDDATTAYLPLSFDFSVMAPAKLTPSRLNFGELAQGEQKSMSATITVADGLKLNFVGTAREKLLETELKKLSADGDPDVWQVTVHASKDLPPGNFATMLALLTDHPRIQSIGLAIAGKVYSPVKFEPGDGPARVLDFGNLRTDQQGQRKIRITNRRPDIPYVIKRVEVQGQLASVLETEVTSTKPGVAYEIELRVPAGLAAGKFVGKIVVHADHPTDATRFVRFRGLVE